MGELKKIFHDNIPAFWVAVIVGVIAHGFMLFNKFSYHDDMLLFSLGGTFDYGRWGLGIMEKLAEYTGLGWISSPMFMGSLSLIFIGANAVLVCEILHVRRRMRMVLLGAVMAVFPAVASIFAYMFTAALYFFAYFLLALAVYMISEEHPVKRCFAAACLIALSTGIYQAALAVCASLMVLTLINHVLKDPERTFAGHFREVLAYASTFLGGVVLYFAVNWLALMLTGSEATSYQGMNEKYDVTRLPGKLIEAYHNFLGGGYNGINSTPFLADGVKAVIVLTVIGVLACLYQSKCDKIIKLWALFLMLLFPAAAYLVIFFSTGEAFEIYTLMVYSLVYVFIFPIFVMERMEHGKRNKEKKIWILLAGVWKYALTFMVAMFILLYAYYDNAAYLKINFVQEQTIAYLNTLATQIKSAEGYKDEYPVVLLGYGHGIKDQSFFHSEDFDKIAITGYQFDQEALVNDYLNIRYLKYHVGYEPEFYYDYTDWWELPEVQEMSCYPDSGSIKVINGGVVVKFAEYEEE